MRALGQSAAQQRQQNFLLISFHMLKVLWRNQRSAAPFPPPRAQKSRLLLSVVCHARHLCMHATRKKRMKSEGMLRQQSRRYGATVTMLFRPFLSLTACPHAQRGTRMFCFIAAKRRSASAVMPMLSTIMLPSKAARGKATCLPCHCLATPMRSRTLLPCRHYLQ